MFRSYLVVVLAVCGLLLSGCGGDSSAMPGGSSAARNCAPDTRGMPTEACIFGWIQDLVAMAPRMNGTPGGRRASAYLRGQFEKFGLKNVHYETATTWHWQVSKASLSVNGEHIDSSPIRFSFITLGKPSEFSTGPDGLTAEIVDVGQGKSLKSGLQDVKGKIVLFNLKFTLRPADLLPLEEYIWDPDSTIPNPTFRSQGNPFVSNIESVAKAAMEAGAVGVIGVLDDYFNSNKYRNEFYRHTPITIPGLWVSSKDGARLRRIMAASEGTDIATLHLRGSRKHARARTVVGFLPGKSKDTIMVQSHYDSVTPGAVEDASGTAEVLAQARYFASRPPELRKKTLMFVLQSSHFTGYQAHRAFVEKYITNKATPYNIVANVTLEHIAKQGKIDEDGNLVIVDRPEFRAVFETLGPVLTDSLIVNIADHDLRRTAVLEADGLCSNALLPTDAAEVCAAGVPTVSLISGPIYLYDEVDTLDKVYRDGLVPVAKASADLIEAIDKTPSERIGGLPLSE